MTALPIKNPSSDVSTGSWSTVGSGASFSARMADADDGTSVVGGNKTNGDTLIVELAPAMPADFQTLDALLVTMRLSFGRSSIQDDDTISLSAQIIDASGSSLSSTILIRSSSSYETGIFEEEKTMTGLLDVSNKTRWDGARLKIIQGYDQNMSGDTIARAYVRKAWVHGTYTASAPTGGQPNARVSGAFALKPLKVRSDGVFSEKPLKVKVGGVWQDA